MNKKIQLSEEDLDIEKRCKKVGLNFIGKLKEDKKGKKIFFPSHYISFSSGVGFDLEKFSKTEAIRHILNEYNKIPGRPYELQRHRKFDKLRLLEKEFEKTKNPFIPIKIFLVSFYAGVYPPYWVFHHIIKIFRVFDESFGEKSLDELFGVNRGKWKPTHKQKFLEETRDEMLCLDMFRLQRLFKMKVEHSSDLVAELLMKDKTYGSIYEFRVISSETIKDKYFKKFKKKFSKNSLVEKSICSWEPQEIAEFMSKFPKASLIKSTTDYPILKTFYK